LREVGRALGKPIKELEATNDGELDAALASLRPTGVDALVVPNHPLFFTRMTRIVAAVAQLAIPTLYFRREFAVAGGLVSYGSSAAQNYRTVGDYVGRILKGTKPSDLPVVQPTRFEFVINLKTAKALGLTIPPGILAIADEVIE
jgi:putative ABC transport system substrate-binding protein